MNSIISVTVQLNFETMKTFNLNSFIHQPRTVMQHIGMWPERNPSLSYDLRGIISFILPTVYTILGGIKCFEDFKEGNYESSMYILCLMLLSFHTLFKVWFMQIQKPLFFQILFELEDFSLASHQDNSDKYLQDKINLNRKVFNFIYVSCLFAAGAIIISEFLFDYKSAPRCLAIYADFNTDPITYLFGWIFFVITTFQAGFIIGSYEGLLFTFLCLGVTQLQILQEEIKLSIDFYATQALSSKEFGQYDQLTNQLLMKCVQRQNTIDRYVEAIERKFSPSYLVLLMLAMGVTGLIGLNFIFVPVKSADFAKCVCLLIVDTTQLLFTCFSCNQIIIESEMIGEACYMSNWRLHGPLVRKTIYIIMERSKRPLRITAAKFVTMSLETYINVLKTSASYYTVLKNLYVPED